MRNKKIKIDGETIKIYYPAELEDTITNQLEEILKQECYREGRRKKDAIYLDLGANIGMASLYFRKWAKMIYALEPNPVIFEALKKNTEKYDNIKIFNVGIVPYTGKNLLYSDNSRVEAQNLFVRGNSKGVFSIYADFMGMDDFFKENNIKHIDVMKIDVEGAEYIILPSIGFAKVAPKIDFIIGESHFEGGEGFPDIIPVILNEYGYKTKSAVFKNKGFMNSSNTFQFSDDYTRIQKNYHVNYNTLFTAER